MINEHERVVLTEDLPEHDLKTGDIGVVVMIHGDHIGYELEIFGADGHTIDVVSVYAHQVRPVKRHDVLHVRVMPESA